MTDKNNKIVTVLAAMLIVVVSFIVLRELKSILIPFFIALILTFIFEPLYIFLKEKKIPSALAIIVILLIIIIVSNIASIFIITSVNSFTAGFPKYEAKVREIVTSLFQLLQLSDTEIQHLNQSLQIKNLLMQGSLTAALTGIFSSVVGIFGDFILILIYLVFLLTEMGSIRVRIKKAYTQERANKIEEITGEIFTDVKKYIVGKTLVNLLQGIVFGFILWAFGVDFYLVWAFLCFFSHYIPNIGSLISTILPALIAILQFDNIITPIIIIVLLIVVQNVIGNILEPKYLGDQLDLSPLLLLFSLIFWGYVWGIIGMILSVPIMSMLKIVLSKFEGTRSIAVLMSYNKTQTVKSESYIRTRVKAIIKRKKIQ